MLIVAERMNATHPAIARALQQRDASLLAREAHAQTLAGADFLDVNAGSVPEREGEHLRWAVGIIQQNTHLPLCLDSSSPDVLRGALELVEGDRVMLNSATAESGKMEEVVGLAAEAGALLICLTMDDEGVPKTADRRVQIAARLVEAAREAGVAAADLYLDPCVQPISTDVEQGPAVIEAVRRISRQFPGVHTTCGLSNVSFGLPDRDLINRTYLAALMGAGLDSAILDPTAPGMMETVYAADALTGRDEFCMEYIKRMRDRAE